MEEACNGVYSQPLAQVTISLAVSFSLTDLTSDSLARVTELIKQFKHLSVNQLGYIVEEVNLLAVISSGLAKYNRVLDENSIDVQVHCDDINLLTY